MSAPDSWRERLYIVIFQTDTRADGDRQQTGQAQAWVALEEHLADAAQEDSGCIEERLQGHGGQCGKGRSAGTEMPGLREGRGRSL